MQNSKKKWFPIAAAWLLLAIMIAGCAGNPGAEAPFEVVEPAASSGDPVDLASLPAYYSSTVTATPAPGGFIPGDSLPTPAPPEAAAESEYRELTWEELVPVGYRPEDIMAKYQEKLSSFQDGDPAAMEVYMQMQEEFNNAPINSELNEIKIRLPGFIAPLEYQDGLITEFLLVPYFGACIHVPPPPVNQTVHITTAEGVGILPEDSYYPVWVDGIMLTEGTSTDIGVAGYRIQNATISPYVYSGS